MNFKALIGATFALTLNRSETDAAKFTLPADGWYQISKTGAVTKTLEIPGGKSVRIRQVITDADHDAIVAHYRAKPEELLVDYDHFSADSGKQTTAGAWITDVEARGDGLFAQMRLSSSGRAALEGGDYRHFSPVLGFPVRDYKAGEEAHPVALLGGALTNQPTFKGMLPLSNRYESSPPEHNNTMDYKAILLALLGLPGTATDAEIHARQAAFPEKVKAADELPVVKNRLAKLEGEQIERDLDAKGLKGAERETWKGALTKNRDEALVLLATVKGGESSKGGYGRMHNRDNAEAPAGGGGDAEQDSAVVDRKRDAAVAEYRTKNRCDFETAWDAVKNASPELFAETR